MAPVTTAGAGRQVVKTLALGTLTALLYAALFAVQDLVLQLSALGGWYFLVPVTIAFVFSLVHGAFTGHFWDLLGVRARK
jgi:hypothetical protein